MFNLKSAASTLIFLEENGFDDMEKLNEKSQQAKDDFNNINTRIQGIDVRLKDISALQKHIGAYSKTREVYAALAAEKKTLYSGYHQARKYMQDILAARQNTAALLNYRETKKEKETERI